VNLAATLRQRKAAAAPSPERRRTRGARTQAAAPPIEHRLLITATLCLLAFGAVMVYSASSPPGVLAGQGLGTGTFIRYVVFAGVGLAAMQLLSRRGLALLDERMLRLFVIGSTALLLLVLVPGFGKDVLGARRWFAAGPIQFQPSELVKLALVLYVARYLADNPKRVGSRLVPLITPIAVVAGPACLLIVLEPDMGTMLVIAFTLAALLLAAGVPMRQLGLMAALGVGVVLVFALAQPYQRMRLESFLNPWASRSGAGYQAVQGQIALGSGGVFGVGLGRSVQKIFYVTEAPTDFILAVVGEELGVVGIALVAVLYGMLGYAGFRTARRARDRYAKLLASGLTSLILCQGVLNIFVVLGLAPLTGVPLPFISYAPTNLCVMLASVGLLLNIARPGRRLQLVEAPTSDADADRDRRRRDRGARRARTGGRRRAAG
jgi:cell division protein FtsW